MQRMSSDWIVGGAPKSETRRAEFLGHQSYAVDERTRDQGVPPFFASDNADIILSPEEIDSVAAYIVGLAGK